LPVKALNSPPIASISVEIVRAVGRRSVPLKNMCSAKCAMPCDSRVSYREPAASITKHETEPTWSFRAVTTRTPFPSIVFSKIPTDVRWYRQRFVPGLTRTAIAAQPEWLRQVPERVGDVRLPEGARVLFTGCGTSFHAALACGPAAHALEVVTGHGPEADVLVAISHEGRTKITLEAAKAFAGETWLITGAADSPIGEAVDHVLVATPAIEESYCHTVSYTCGVAAGRALRGEDVSGLADQVARELDAEPLGVSGHDRFVVVGAGGDTATALEAVLKLREGVHVAAEAHHTEQLLHGHLAAIDPDVRCLVLEGTGRAAERAADVMRALGELGCEAALVPTVHPVVDIVRFQRLTCDLAEARGIDPDRIRWDEEPWDRARKSY
jgi:glucosamine--fructose-6-phosphate aminotransferase (isomerizing)